MLAIARALMSEPRLLMLDEPSMGLAPLVIEEILEIVRDLAQEGTTILLVEQNVRFGLRIASEGVVMESGRVLLTGKADDVLNNPEMAALYFGGTVERASANGSAAS